MAAFLSFPQDSQMPYEHDDLRLSHKGLSIPYTFTRFDQLGTHKVLERLAQEDDVVISFGNDFSLSGACTPIDLLDYAVGLSFDSGIIESMNEIEQLHETKIDSHWLIEMKLYHVSDIERRFSKLSTRKSQSLFVKEIGFDKPLSPAYQLNVPIDHYVSPQVIWDASKRFRLLQTLNRSCGSTHAAAFITWDNEFLVVREDIARHSALVKTIGACLRSGIKPQTGFIFLSSRCAAELAIKVARFGVELVATVSAPTITAAAFAQRVGLTVCSYARDGRFTAYAHPERIVGFE